MPLDLFVFGKAIAAGFGRVVKALLAARTLLRKTRAEDQTAWEKTISRAIKRHPGQTALGAYLRDFRARETIRTVSGLLLSPSELPAFYAYMAEAHASERDLRLAWPHRTLSAQSTFEFVLGPAEQLRWWWCFGQSLFCLLGATGAFLMARLTPRSELAQMAYFVELMFCLILCSAAPMGACRSVRAARRILHRRARSH